MTGLGKTHFLSIEDYLAGEENSPFKREYLGGAVHAKAGGSADHAAISANAIGSLITQLRGKPCRSTRVSTTRTCRSFANPAQATPAIRIGQA